MSHECEIREQLPQPALAIRTRTPVQNLSQVIDDAYRTITQYLEQAGEQPAGPMFVGYYNRDMNDLDVEVGFPVSPGLEGNDRIHPTEIPGGKVGICLHTGPYHEAGPAYEDLTKMVKNQGFETTGVAYESYLNNPMDTTPEKLQTQILFPLKAPK